MSDCLTLELDRQLEIDLELFKIWFERNNLQFTIHNGHVYVVGSSVDSDGNVYPLINPFEIGVLV